MIILLSNDDGIHAPGLRALYEALQGLGEIWVVAPAEEKSGVGHGFIQKGPLEITRADWVANGRGFAVNGNPADAVKVAVRALLPVKPKLVVSGINRGENSGVDLIYSGTVAAAREAAFMGIPAIAVSRLYKQNDDFSTAGFYARQICEMVMKKGLPDGVLLNVNVPMLAKENIKGIKFTHQAKSHYEEIPSLSWNHDNIGYLDWIKYRKIVLEDSDHSDYSVVRDGWVSVSPIHHRLTDYEFLEGMGKIQ